MTEQLRTRPRLGIVATTVDKLQPGDEITGGDLKGHITAIEHGPHVGIYLAGSDMRWLLPADREITIRRTR